MSRTMPLPARVRRRLTGSLAATALAASGVLAMPAAPAHAAITRTMRIENAVTIALHQIGDPYRYGAAGPNAFDCSGLLYYSMRRAGFGHFPRTASEQSHWGRPISKAHLRPGDLIFFVRGGYVYHAAIFLRWRDGHAVMLHAPRPGEYVRRDRPWTTAWFARTLR